MDEVKNIIYAINYATINAVQGHHWLLIELKRYNVIICIDGKTGGGRKLGAAVPSLEPRLVKENGGEGCTSKAMGKHHHPTSK